MDLTQLDALIEGTTSFRWREALWCPTWKVYVLPTPGQKANIIKVAQPLQAIRDRYGKPMTITSWLRPELYNEWKYPHGVSGAKASQHVLGAAVDFKILTMSCEEIRLDLAHQLEHLNIRMERADGQDRVHIDIKRVLQGDNRYFYPSGSLG
jgi:hypothetical protein